MICSKCGTGGGLMETAAQCRGPLQETIHHCNNNRLLLFHSPAQWKMYFSFLIFPAGFLRSTCREARSSGRLLMAGCPHLWTFFFHFQRIFVKEMDTAGQPDPSLFERSTLSLFFRSRTRFLCWRNGRPVRMSSSFFFIDSFFLLQTSPEWNVSGNFCCSPNVLSHAHQRSY